MSDEKRETPMPSPEPRVPSAYVKLAQAAVAVIQDARDQGRDDCMDDLVDEAHIERLRNAIAALDAIAEADGAELTSLADATCRGRIFCEDQCPFHKRAADGSGSAYPRGQLVASLNAALERWTPHLRGDDNAGWQLAHDVRAALDALPKGGAT